MPTSRSPDPIQNTLATVLGKQNKHAPAVSFLREALEIDEASLGPGAEHTAGM